MNKSQRKKAQGRTARRELKRVSPPKPRTAPAKPGTVRGNSNPPRRRATASTSARKGSAIAAGPTRRRSTKVEDSGELIMGFTLSDIARGIGKTPSFMSRLRRSNRRPSTQTLGAIAKFLGVDTDTAAQLLGGKAKDDLPKPVDHAPREQMQAADDGMPEAVLEDTLESTLEDTLEEIEHEAGVDDEGDEGEDEDEEFDLGRGGRP
jgi:transcriptional regulator with XRE-family HTH domain